jgi:predicted HTH domain antitoxin
MTLTLPKNLEQGHSNEWAALHFAIGLYVSHEVTLGQAAEVAGLSQADFQRELGRRKIPSNYTMEDLQADLQTVRELTAR